MGGEMAIAMAQFAQPAAVVIVPVLGLGGAGAEGNVQDNIKTYVSQHDALGARTSKAEHWHDNLRDWLRQLRRRYFHFSAHYSSPTVVGHILRLEGGERIRQVHRG